MKNTKYLYDGQDLTDTISASQIQSYMSCPKKWSYNYIERLTPRVERPYLTIGKLCHSGMYHSLRCMYYGTDDFNAILDCGLNAIRGDWERYMNSVQFLDEEIPEQDKVLEDALSVFRQALKEFDPLKYEVDSVIVDGELIPALELHFIVPCAYSKGLHGYIDSILIDKETGIKWCVDYKFRKSLSDDTEEQFNIQNAIYMYACRKMGIDVSGTITWQHKNTPASIPAILKNGSISRAKISTTWDMYSKFCIDNGQNPDDYIDMKEKLEEIEWYRPTCEIRNEETINNMWKNVVVPISRSIKYEKKKKSHAVMMFQWNCKMCQYASLCQGELRGYDIDYIKSTQYSQKKDR